MENTVFGMSPMTFITFMGMFVFAFCVACVLIIKEGIKNAIKDKDICVFVTKSRGIEILLLPEAGGRIVAPPHHKFEEGVARTYFVNRDFSLHGWFPPLMPRWIQETATYVILEEGDPQPFLPSNQPSFVTPQMVQALINQNIIALLVKRVNDEFDKVKGALGQLPWYFWLVIGLTLVLVAVNAWIGLNILNILLP